MLLQYLEYLLIQGCECVGIDHGCQAEEVSERRHQVRATRNWRSDIVSVLVAACAEVDREGMCRVLAVLC